MADVSVRNIHIVPLNDWLPHKDYGKGCGCNPRIEPGVDGTVIVVHNSWDGRELYERGETERGQ